MVYSYFVRRDHLTDDQIDVLKGKEEVLSEFSPREIRDMGCFDCCFPNGDAYPLTEEEIDITSCKAVDIDWQW